VAPIFRFCVDCGTVLITVPATADMAVFGEQRASSSASGVPLLATSILPGSMILRTGVLFGRLVDGLVVTVRHAAKPQASRVNLTVLGQGPSSRPSGAEHAACCSIAMSGRRL
jgi:hypothetical protein